MTEINIENLKKIIEEYFLPLWNKSQEGGPLRKGGGEIYIQEKVLKKTAQSFTKEAIKKDVRQCLLNGLKNHVNLLSKFEFSYAKTFIELIPQETLKVQIESLFFGTNELLTRLNNFLDWAEIKPVSNEEKKMGIKGTACSFFLSLAAPKQYPFCKPVAYKSAVTMLCDKKVIVFKYEAKRIVHCQKVYSEVLKILENDYGLIDGNLLDVHSLFYLFSFYEKKADTDFIKIMSRYKDEGTVFQSAVQSQRYCVSSVGESKCTVERLDANEPQNVTAQDFIKKFELLRDNNGSFPFKADFHSTVAVRNTLLQAVPFGLSPDKQNILDLSESEKALSNFCEVITNLNVNITNGNPTLYKPAMLACVIEAIKTEELKSNKIEFDWILPMFIEKMKSMGIEATEENAAMPFFHLTGDLFWMLCYHDTSKIIESGAATPGSIRSRVKHAIIKDTYWNVLQTPEICDIALNALSKKWWPNQPEQLPQVWWVNQGKTFTQERFGSFIWAPLKDSKGRSLSHWESLAQVKRGDIVINYSKANIVAISISREKAYEYENELSDALWSNTGRRIDLDYYDLSTPIKYEEIKLLIPSLKQDIKSNGPFNVKNEINLGYLFRFSIDGLRQLCNRFPDRIPQEIIELLFKGKGDPKMSFYEFLKREGFYFSSTQVKRFILSLKTKPFVILTGNSGTGKTKLAQLYAQYINSLYPKDSLLSQSNDVMTRRWFKLSFNDTDVVQSFQGTGKKIDQIRETILNEGLMSLGWLDNDDDRAPNQKEMMKDLKPGDVIIAYQGGFTIGGIGFVEEEPFIDDKGDAFEAFNESTKNFVRIDWKFRGPLRIKDFQFEEYKTPGFGMWVDTIHKLNQSQVDRFAEYLKDKGVRLGDTDEFNSETKYALIPVGGNWTDKRHLLGFHNVITQNYHRTKALNIILEALKTQKRGMDIPFFLILDEMNLSHVERYFSDFLSALESEEKIPLHNSDEIEQDQDIPKELILPNNLYVIGTVNVDETTYMFSPKVLDRANVIEFKTMSALNYLKETIGNGDGDFKDITFPEDASTRKLMPVSVFQRMAHVKIKYSRTSDLTEKVSHEINTFQKALEQIGFDFGFRVINEMIIYLYLAWEADGKPTTWDGWVDAFDIQILQKMIPKIHGSAKIIGNILKCLYCLCFSGKSLEQVNKLCNGDVVAEIYDKSETMARYKQSAQKLKKMQKDLETQRYVSFT